jgi:hypothetical protein
VPEPLVEPLPAVPVPTFVPLVPWFDEPVAPVLPVAPVVPVVPAAPVLPVPPDV